MKKVLLACLEHAPGINPPEFSIEYLNFYLPLLQIKNVEIDFFPLDKVNVLGGRQISLELKSFLERKKFDLLIIVSFYHNLDKKIFQEIKERKLTETLAIFFDEDTDLYQRSLSWAPYLDHLITFYPPAYQEYKKRGYNVLGMDWFVNREFYNPGIRHQESGVNDIDVSFIGSAKPERKKLVEKIKRAGINIQTWGVGWPNGPVNFKQMIDIFRRSKINLNLGMGKSIWRWQTPFRIFFSPAKNKFGLKLNLKNIVGNWKTIINRRQPQCRARPFEIMACRAFVLTNSNAPLFGDFQDGENIAFYRNEKDLIAKIKYYLTHDAERKAIANRAYQKIIKENSAVVCWENILSKVVR